MQLKATTILGIRKGKKVALGGDGQITLGDMAFKHGTRKVRKIFGDKVLAGFAGSAADSMTLLSMFEKKLEEFSGNLTRAAIELARKWRTEKYLRQLEAMLIVMDAEKTFIINGSGEIIEPDDGVAAIGSGAGYALSAARAYIDGAKDMPPAKIVEKSLKIASNICLYTNDHITVLELQE